MEYFFTAHGKGIEFKSVREAFRSERELQCRRFRARLGVLEICAFHDPLRFIPILVSVSPIYLGAPLVRAFIQYASAKAGIKKEYRAFLKKIGQNVSPDRREKEGIQGDYLGIIISVARLVRNLFFQKNSPRRGLEFEEKFNELVAFLDAHSRALPGSTVRRGSKVARVARKLSENNVGRRETLRSALQGRRAGGAEEIALLAYNEWKLCMPLTAHKKLSDKWLKTRKEIVGRIKRRFPTIVESELLFGFLLGDDHLRSWQKGEVIPSGGFAYDSLFSHYSVSDPIDVLDIYLY